MVAGAQAPAFSEYPRRWRIPLAHLLTDQAAVTSLLYNQQEREPHKRFAYYVGAGLSFALAWWIGTTVGVVLQIEFYSPENYFAVLKPGDKLMGMDLSCGGHLTHGSPVNFSGRLYEVHAYGVTRDDERIVEGMDENQVVTFGELKRVRIRIVVSITM